MHRYSTQITSSVLPKLSHPSMNPSADRNRELPERMVSHRFSERVSRTDTNSAAKEAMTKSSEPTV
jgi:hypothetical protein